MAMVSPGRNMALFFARRDARLAEREFLASDRYTVADITALCVVEFARVCKLRIPDGCANLKRWHDAIRERPSTAESMKPGGDA